MSNINTDRMSVPEVDALLARIRGRIIASHNRRDLYANILTGIAKELISDADIERVAEFLETRVSEDRQNEFFDNRAN